jgi:hypothetical protein
MPNHDDLRLAVFILLPVLLIGVSYQNTHSQEAFRLTPISGADGVFETMISEGDTIYRTVGSVGSYAPYMYFGTDQNIPPQTVYLEVTYKDVGFGEIFVHYNSSQGNYTGTRTGYQNYSRNSGSERVAVYELQDADFRDAQNLNADLRLWVDVSYQMHIVSAHVYLEPTPIYLENNEDWISPYEGQEYIGDNLVDATSLAGKVICGYQGWFRARGDGTGSGWGHYANHDFSDLTIDMWPDMLEYSEAEKYLVPGWIHENGNQAYLFSSANKKTVIRHFQWMETYGIDGVAVQRFVGGLDLSHPKESFRIAGYAREAANRTGRTYFIMYDMSGDEDVGEINADWRYLVDVMKITEDDRYLHHNGLPVVAVFGFFAGRFAAALGNQVLDIFQNGGKYGAFVIGSGQWPWRTETAPGWPELFRRMDAWMPWNVGNYSGDFAETSYWRDDKDEMTSSGVLYMPLVYPGFGWDNLQNDSPGTSTIPRRKGEFMWQQFLDAEDIDAATVYVAMFDEIDESTAIFKVTNDVPVDHYFLTLEDLPSDFYLLMTGFGTKLINGGTTVPGNMPDFTAQSQPPIPEILSPAYGDTVTEVSINWSPVAHESGINGYELELDNQIIPVSTTDYNIALDPGEHIIRIRAINGLNNEGGFSEAVFFTVQNNSSEFPQLPACVPGWTGRLIIGCESTSGWGIEQDNGSTGTVETTAGVFDNAVQLNWDIGTGNWVQARYAFDGLIDLSLEDIFGISLRGDNGISNRVAVMFRDADGVFFGFNCDNLSNVDRWMINLSLPKKLLTHFFTFGPDPNDRIIDWSRIDRFYVVVGRPGEAQGGGSGRLAVDHVQADRAGDWPRQTEFENIVPDQASIDKSVAYILSKQNNTGLFTSWSSGSEAYMYDQGLVLIVVTREGVWQNGIPQNESARAAKKLADFLVANQKPAGNWASAWDAPTGNEIGPPVGVGGDSYVVMALVTYANKAGDAAAWDAAETAGEWLAGEIDEMGRLVPSTENNLDASWELVATRRWRDADRIEHYLLNTVWDPDLRYWWRGYAGTPDPFIAMDCATWVAEFAKSSRVGRPDMAKAALSFVHRTLMTTDETYTYCGLDAMGPIGVWCEGMAGYINAGGEGSQDMLNTMLALQSPNGGMPSSTENRWNCFGWLSTMTGLAPTSWFYFAQTKSPFEDLISPGNMVINGSFSDGETDWILTALLPGQATGSIQNGEYAVSITNGGNFVWDINLKQENLSIENGKNYSVSFDAYAAAPRQIAALVGKNSDPWTVYSGNENFSLTTSKQNYSYSFTMQEATDPIARLGFDVGLSTVDVFFDNITLTEVEEPTTVAVDPGESASPPTDFNLLQNYPNPFNPETTIEYQLPVLAEVTLTIYDLQGQVVQRLDYGTKAAGHHSVEWDGRNDQGLKVTSGIYFYRIEMKRKDAGQRPFVAMKKMILMK